MSTTETNFHLGNDSQPWVQVAEGMRRQVLAYDPQMMLVRVAFEKGGIGALHHHVHTQITYVQSGVFKAVVGEETRVMHPGDVFYAPSNVWHSVECLEAGVLVDTFSPMREDFI
ncbi:cupin domain-containing protein [Hymenobacter sp. YC55]|uniref:cupin domain-containing protein n=1 Tax=Hymenobacter sp. YC55 TaxID=3034019 RepID=UPI0023F908F1|nr:cupin domain-containing protein [Hymenobacter sp. YC55]MDF7810859.1 cupin domain-containing protein [Hymenobacter sp. YC55]